MRDAADLRTGSLAEVGEHSAGIFETRTGREPRYHLSIEEAPEWAYRNEPLAPLSGYPSVMWERPGRKKKGTNGRKPKTAE